MAAKGFGKSADAPTPATTEGGAAAAAAEGDGKVSGDGGAGGVGSWEKQYKVGYVERLVGKVFISVDFSVHVSSSSSVMSERDRRTRPASTIQGRGSKEKVETRQESHS